MITVSLINEIYFISHFFNQPIRNKITFENLGEDFLLDILVTPDGNMDIWYKGNHIWNEMISGDLSFWGTESADSISRTIACINNNDPSWKDLYYYNQSQEKTS